MNRRKMEYFCRQCGENIGEITEPIQLSGSYETDNGYVEVSLKNTRAIVISGSEVCKKCVTE